MLAVRLGRLKAQALELLVAFAAGVVAGAQERRR
jgi:hypothetical protein